MVPPIQPSHLSIQGQSRWQCELHGGRICSTGRVRTEIPITFFSSNESVALRVTVGVALNEGEPLYASSRTGGYQSTSSTPGPDHGHVHTLTLNTCLQTSVCVCVCDLYICIYTYIHYTMHQNTSLKTLHTYIYYISIYVFTTIHTYYIYIHYIYVCVYVCTYAQKPCKTL